MLDPQPTPWSPPAPSELSDTIRHEISSGKYMIFIIFPMKNGGFTIILQYRLLATEVASTSLMWFLRSEAVAANEERNNSVLKWKNIVKYPQL